MAKSNPGAKSQAISEYLAENKAASPKQVVEALKEKGIQVSFGLASVVKYGKGKKKAKPKPKWAKQTAVAKSKPAVSSSELIRRFIAKNPKAKPREIEAGLKAEGTKVKLSLVNAVKYAKGKKKGGKTRRAGTQAVHAAARAIPSSTVSFDQLVEVKRLADSLGGAGQVRQALDSLAQLQ